MKKRYLIALILSLVALPFLAQAVTVTEDFESYAVGSELGASGWTYWVGNGTLGDFTIAKSERKEMSGKSVLLHDGADIQIFKPFRTPPEITDDTPKIAYTVLCVPRVSGANVQGIDFGARMGPNKVVALFKVIPGSGGFQVEVNRTPSEKIYKAGQLYEIRLLIDQTNGPLSALGSVFIRNLSQDEAQLAPVEGLQNVPMGLVQANKASLWRDWVLRCRFKQEVYRLTLTTDGL